jgi:hypothetical protein
MSGRLMSATPRFTLIDLFSLKQLTFSEETCHRLAYPRLPERARMPRTARLERGDGRRKITRQQKFAQEIDVFVARHPDLHPVGRVDARLAPADRVGRFGAGARTRTLANAWSATEQRWARRRAARNRSIRAHSGRPRTPADRAAAAPDRAERPAHQARSSCRAYSRPYSRSPQRTTAAPPRRRRAEGSTSRDSHNLDPASREEILDALALRRSSSSGVARRGHRHGAEPRARAHPARWHRGSLEQGVPGTRPGQALRTLQVQST